MSKDTSLQLNVARLTEAGLNLTFSLGPEWFARWQQEDPQLEFPGLGQFEANVHLAKHGKDILLRGLLKGHLSLTCSRCLEPFSIPVEADFDLLLAPKPGLALQESEELAAADLDLDFYSGDLVDLEGFFREQILLMIPLKPLCSETCRGICPHCGSDRNRQTCNCQDRQDATPLATLAELKK